MTNTQCRMQEYPYPESCIYVLFASLHSRKDNTAEEVLAGKALVNELEADLAESETEYYTVVARSLKHAVNEVNRFLIEGEKVRAAFSLDEVKLILEGFKTEEKIKVLSLNDNVEYKNFVFKTNNPEDDYVFFLAENLNDVGLFVLEKEYTEGEILEESDLLKLKEKMEQVQYGKSQHLYCYGEEEENEDEDDENAREYF